MDSATRSDEALLRLVEESHLARPDELSVLADRAARRLGAEYAAIYLISHEQTQLVPLDLPGHRFDAVSVDTTLAGRAFRTVETQETTHDGRSLLWVPMVDGVARLGVLSVAVDPDVDDDEFRLRITRLASLASELVVTKRVYGDTVERAIRLRPMSLAGELLWRLLPPLTVGTDRLVLSATLEPAYDVGGDAFDYAIDGDVARFALFDAMGHGLSAGLLASVALAAYRSARRSGGDLVDCVRRVDHEVAAQFGGDRFLTGILAELEVGSGLLRLVRAGHPPPLLLRDRRVVKQLDGAGSVPLGIGVEDVPVLEEQLQPGDRVLLYTDGIPEARDESGEFFGVERLGDFVARESATGEPAPEVLRRLTQALLAHQGGQLQDDASLLLVEWRTGDEDALLP